MNWFGQLPAPLQSAGIALGALAAAAGPILLTIGGLGMGITTLGTALAPIAGALGVTTVALGGWAIAIAGAVAALVALGAWVNENWEPIKATVLQAWAGVSELWSTAWTSISSTLTGAWQSIKDAVAPAWTPIASFLSSVWGPVSAAATVVWEAYKSYLGGVWGTIKSVAESVWGGIVGMFQKFIEWAGKIPGAAKLINLDEAWKSAQQLKDSLADTNDELKENKKKSKDAGTANTNLGRDLAALAKKADTSTESMKARKFADELLVEKVKLVKSEHESLGRELAKTKTALEGTEASSALLSTELINQAAQISTLAGAITDLSSIKLPGLITQTGSMATASNNLGTALGALGVKSATEYQKIATDAKAAYDAVMGSGVATDWEQKNAMLAMLKAQKDAAVANSTAIPAEMQATITNLETLLKGDNGVKKIEGPFGTLATNVSTTMGNLAKGLTDALFSGETSWAEKGKAALSSLASAVTDSFVTPATTALKGFIDGVLADLLGGKGFGGVLNHVQALSGGFPAAGTAGSAGGAGGSGGSRVPVGGGGGTAGSVAGNAGAVATAGMVGSIAGAVSGFISNFQQAGMNKSLDLVVLHTLQTANDLSNLRADEWTREKSLMAKIDDVWATVREAASNTFWSMKKLDSWHDDVTKISDVEFNTYWSLRKLEDFHAGHLQDVDSHLLDMTKLIASNSKPAAPIINITVDGNVIGNRDFMRELAHELSSTLRAQYVAV